MQKDLHDKSTYVCTCVFDNWKQELHNKLHSPPALVRKTIEDQIIQKQF